MLKDEFITKLDALASDPENLLANAAALRQEVSADYDELSLLKQQNESLQNTLTNTQKELSEQKNLSLKLFMSQPSVSGNNDPQPEPLPSPNPEPPIDEYTSMDEMLTDIRKNTTF